MGQPGKVALLVLALASCACAHVVHGAAPATTAPAHVQGPTATTFFNGLMDAVRLADPASKRWPPPLFKPTGLNPGLGLAANAGLDRHEPIQPGYTDDLMTLSQQANAALSVQFAALPFIEELARHYLDEGATYNQREFNVYREEPEWSIKYHLEVASWHAGREMCRQSYAAELYNARHGTELDDRMATIYPSLEPWIKGDFKVGRDGARFCPYLSYHQGAVVKYDDCNELHPFICELFLPAEPDEDEDWDEHPRPPRPDHEHPRPPRPDHEHPRPPRPTTERPRPPRPTTVRPRPPRPDYEGPRPDYERPRPNRPEHHRPRPPVTEEPWDGDGDDYWEGHHHETRPPWSQTRPTRPPWYPRPTTTTTTTERPEEHEHEHHGHEHYEHEHHEHEHHGHEHHGDKDEETYYIQTDINHNGYNYQIDVEITLMETLRSNLQALIEIVNETGADQLRISSELTVEPLAAMREVLALAAHETIASRLRKLSLLQRATLAVNVNEHSMQLHKMAADRELLAKKLTKDRDGKQPLVVELHELLEQMELLR